MGIGILEVKLVDAKGLKSTELFGQGGSPVWNEKFTFRAEYHGGRDGEYKLTLTVMDKDTFTADDFIGQTSICVKDLLAVGVENGVGELHPSKYRIVGAGQNYCGEIRVGVKFTPKEQQVEANEEEEYGGWKHSEY